MPAPAAFYARVSARSGAIGGAWYSAATATAMAAAVGLASVAFNQVPALVAGGGLYQRAAVITGFAWLTALALHTLRVSGGR